MTSLSGIRTRQKSPQVRAAVVEAVRRWQEQREAAQAQQQAFESLTLDDVLQSMPQREQNANRDERQLWLPFVEPLQFKMSRWRSVGRLFTWFSVLASILLGNLFDQILRRDTIERRAVRLRKALERAGGTFVKLGQQVAMRIDLVPWAYCVELSKMLDRMVPFPTEQALQAVERTIGRPWQEVFEVFDPKPIGSASIACVYQARLKDGTKVVVKIRRPGIAELFRADLQVLDWLADLGEFLTIIRPGFTRNLRIELRTLLLEELDFRREGRFQDIFRRNSSKSGKDFFTAPKVYFELSGNDVLVQEFVSGLWLWEVIALVEQNTPEGRALLNRMNIDPGTVARRILWAAFWSMDEHVFFHADPHPANILVSPNNEITFIDFGSCGSFNNQQKIALEQMVLSMKDNDVEAMTRASLGLMEPLPPVDLPELVKQAQNLYMQVLHTFNTPAKYTQYWERTSARQWFVLIRVSQKFNLPMNLHMLHMIRATLLYDSIVLRLDNQLDRYHEYTQFMKDRAKLVKNRWREKLKDNAGDGFFLNMEELGKSFSDLMIRTQTTLGRPLVHLGSTVDKWIFALSVLSRMVGRILAISILGILLVSLVQVANNQPVSIPDVIQSVAQNHYYQAFVVAALVLNIRHILFRLRDLDR
jgi:predicted unusual protein kinase regulating ubiquinone biosynthesis (AarF/ABC1/UbiB family)